MPGPGRSDPRDAEGPAGRGPHSHRAILREPADGYAPRSPEQTLLHRVVREQLETFLAHTRLRDQPAPRFVEQEFRAYLRCGVLAHGFLRVYCAECWLDRLVPFSCKRRGFCPSCGGRRMADVAKERSLKPAAVGGDRRVAGVALHDAIHVRRQAGRFNLIVEVTIAVGVAVVQEEVEISIRLGRCGRWDEIDVDRLVGDEAPVGGDRGTTGAGQRGTATSTLRAERRRSLA